MSGRNFDSYLGDADAFGALSDEDKARLFAGETLEGETNAEQTTEPVAEAVEETGEAPAAGTVEPTEEQTPEQEPVVLAKDGTHTIPFSELEAARERARLLEQEVLALKSAGQAAQPQAATPAADPLPSVDEALSALVKERDEAMMTGDMDAAHQLSMKIIGIQQVQATQAATAAMEAREAQRQEQETQTSEMAAIQAKVVALVEKYPFLNTQGPSTNQDAIDLVVAKRDQLRAQGVPAADAIEQAVAKVAPLFEKRTTTMPQPAASNAAARAAEVIAKAKVQTPTSLSQVPGGSMAHHDEAEAIRNMSAGQISRYMEGKSPEQIMAMMNKVL